MHKYIYKIFSLILTFTFISCAFTDSVLASPNNNVEVDIETKNADYFENKIIQNVYFREKVSMLEEKGFKFDKNIKSIKDVDFIYYYNDDKSVVGLIQLNDKLNSEIRVNSIDSKPEFIELIKENGDIMKLGKDKQGKFTNILYKTPVYTTYNAASWCPYVVGLAGLPISSLYTYIAGLIGGPIAAAIVSGISSLGWTFVTEQCG